ncbi:MAG: DUF3107 domain-containing protein [Micropruina sp.]|nr:MAG: DUF3107 domain-containing protein [Micropruina sp.]
MEVKVGIVHAAREVTVETEESAEAIAKAFADALDGGVLTLTDERGRRVLIPGDKIAYLDLGQEHARRVGFGSV